MRIVATRIGRRLAFVWGLMLLIGLLSGYGYWSLYLSRYSIAPWKFRKQAELIMNGMTPEEVSRQIKLYDSVSSGPVSQNHSRFGLSRTRFLLRASPKSFLALNYAIDVYFDSNGRVVSVDFADL
jgi:hypothetical protein